MKVYIAGPMRGHPLYNFPAFYAAEERLRAQGWDVYNPARVDQELDGFDPVTGANLQTMEVYMFRDFEAILHQCDAIALLPGWQSSSGATKEHVVAEAVGRQIIDLSLEVPDA